LGALPLVNHFLHRAELPALLARYLPAGDARARLAPAVAVRLVITNLLVGREPLYGLGEWAARFDPALLGLASGEVGLLGDDRVGRALEALFDADRASLLTELLLGVVVEFGIDTTELHNDSTSISVSGVYRDATGTDRGGKPTPVITFGHSKDHRRRPQAAGVHPDRRRGRGGADHLPPRGLPTPPTTPPTSRPGTRGWWRCWGEPTSSTSPTPHCARARRWATSPPAAGHRAAPAPVVVSDEEKAPVKVSGGDQEDERKRTADDVSKLFR